MNDYWKKAMAVSIIVQEINKMKKEIKIDDIEIAKLEEALKDLVKLTKEEQDSIDEEQEFKIKED